MPIFTFLKEYRKGPVQFNRSANRCFENILAILGLLRDSQCQNECYILNIILYSYLKESLIIPNCVGWSLVFCLLMRLLSTYWVREDRLRAGSGSGEKFIEPEIFFIYFIIYTHFKKPFWHYKIRKFSIMYHNNYVVQDLLRKNIMDDTLYTKYILTWMIFCRKIWVKNIVGEVEHFEFNGLPWVGKKPGRILVDLNIPVHGDQRSSFLTVLTLITNIDISQLKPSLGVVSFYDLIPYGIRLVVLNRRGKLDGKKRSWIFIVS